MTPEPSRMGLALAIDFVADINDNPRTNQYRIDLVEPYRSELPDAQNFLLLDGSGFTVDELMAAFESIVIAVYQRKWDEARQRLERVKLSLLATEPR